MDILAAMISYAFIGILIKLSWEASKKNLHIAKILVCFWLSVLMFVLHPKHDPLMSLGFWVGFLVLITVVEMYVKAAVNGGNKDTEKDYSEYLFLRSKIELNNKELRRFKRLNKKFYSRTQSV